MSTLHRSVSLASGAVCLALLAACGSSPRSPAPVEDRSARSGTPLADNKALPGAENAGVVVRPVAAAGRAGAPVPAAASASAPSTASSSQNAVAEDIGLAWPANGQLIAGFDEAKNKGIDIAGKLGDPVLAAADGQVVYAGAGLRGYGNLVIVKHNNTYLTAYAHNQRLLVKEDQRIRRGEKIAEMGSSDADRVKLHFEVRRQGKPVDPAKYLPAR